MKVLSSPSWILIFPLRRPSLLSFTLPVPETWSNSQAPPHVNDTPLLVGLQFTYASSANILSRSACPVSETRAVPQMSMSSLTHWEVSMIRHQPRYSCGISGMTSRR